MKTTRITLGFLMAITAATPLRAQVSAFTYQGQLNLNGAPADGHYDFMFRLLNDPTNGVAAPVIPINLAVPVTNGLFTTGMDFGAENFDGANRWLEINVRTNGGGPFTTLSPRQFLTPTPYAIAANSASNLLGALPAGQISGTILNASLPASASFSGTVTANNFSGNGAGLTEVDAATLGGLNSSDFWRTTGNAGTIVGTHFLGTTDNRPLEIKVNAMRVMRFEPAGDSGDAGDFPDGAPNIIGGSLANNVLSNAVGVTIGGGGATNFGGLASPNSAGGSYSTISGGLGNTIKHDAWISTIAGGGFNVVEYAFYAAIGGGQSNVIRLGAHGAGINGGQKNSIGIGADNASIGGGGYNTIGQNAFNACIAGGNANVIEPFAHAASVAGGVDNIIRADATYASIGGGLWNRIGPYSGYGVVAGGQGNTIGSNCVAATIGGGYDNAIQDDAHQSIIAGGANNSVRSNALNSVVGGGYYNSIESRASHATIPGGFLNSIAGNYAFAAGRQAKAIHDGAFVWGDSASADITSTNDNSVTMRASGGYRLFTDSTATAGAFLAAGSGSWTSMSDRNAKENFTPVDSQVVLAKVAALPMNTWNYRSQDTGIRHIGPMAQDFKAAFGVGESATGISTVDADGVALAAIQGLNQKVEAGDQKSAVRIQKLETENAALKQRLAALEQLVAQINGGGDK